MARPKKPLGATELAASTPGDRVRAARDRAGLTQVQLATAIGMHPISVAKIELGTQRLTAEVAMHIAVAAQISPAELLPDLPWPGTK